MRDYRKFRSYLDSAGLSYDYDSESSVYSILRNRVSVCHVPSYDAWHNFSKAKSAIDFAVGVDQLLQ